MNKDYKFSSKEDYLRWERREAFRFKVFWVFFNIAWISMAIGAWIYLAWFMLNNS